MKTQIFEKINHRTLNVNLLETIFFHEKKLIHFNENTSQIPYEFYFLENSLHLQQF